MTAACVGTRWTCLYPAESCNGRDDDCDGRVDEGGDALCDDGVGCTKDRCSAVTADLTDPAGPGPGTVLTQCVHDPVHTDCDDGVTCTADRCAPEGERGYTEPNADGCVFRRRDPLCDDGCHCNGAETCNPAGAGVTPLSPGSGCFPGAAACESDRSACTVDLCCETSDSCLAALHPAHRARLDRVCSLAEAFGRGRTVKSSTGVLLLCPGASTRLNCDDGNPCTKDACDPVVGCRHEALPDGTSLGLQDEGCTRTSCRAGRILYTRNDSRDTPCQRWAAGRCSQRTCEAALPPNPGAVPLSQGTRFVCVSPTPAVQHSRCDDRVYCNGMETCEPEFDWTFPGFTPRLPGCYPGEPVLCDDGLTCTKDSCDEAGGRCLNEPTAPGACDLL